jgi:hypothetical protein
MNGNENGNASEKSSIFLVRLQPSLGRDLAKSLFRRAAIPHAWALGDEARHGVEPTTPPPNPMSLPEMQAFVTRLLEQWLASK